MNDTFERPTIRISYRKTDAIQPAIAALKAFLPHSRWKLFMRRGLIMQTIPERIEGPHRIPSFITRLRLGTLYEILAEAINWEKQNRYGEWVPADPPAIVTNIRDHAYEWVTTHL